MTQEPIWLGTLLISELKPDGTSRIDYITDVYWPTASNSRRKVAETLANRILAWTTVEGNEEAGRETIIQILLSKSHFTALTEDADGNTIKLTADIWSPHLVHLKGE